MDGDGDTDVLSACPLTTRSSGTRTTATKISPLTPLLVPARRPAACLRRTWTATATSMLSPRPLTTTVLWHENDGNQNFTFHILPTRPDDTIGAYLRRTWTVMATPTSFSAVNRHRLVRERRQPELHLSHHPFRRQLCYSRCMRRTWMATATSTSSPHPTTDDKIAGTRTTGAKTSLSTISHAADGGLSRLCGGRGRRRRPGCPVRFGRCPHVAWYENLNFVVVNTNDSGPGSLRRAIEQLTPVLAWTRSPSPSASDTRRSHRFRRCQPSPIP